MFFLFTLPFCPSCLFVPGPGSLFFHPVLCLLSLPHSLPPPPNPPIIFCLAPGLCPRPSFLYFDPFLYPGNSSFPSSGALGGLMLPCMDFSLFTQRGRLRFFLVSTRFVAHSSDPIRKLLLPSFTSKGPVPFTMAPFALIGPAVFDFFRSGPVLCGCFF